MRSVLFLLTCSVCAAQSLTIGVAGGVRATDDLGYPAISESKRYIAGPSVDIGLPLGFRVEVDALYSREGFRASSGSALAFSNINSSSNVWQFPILVKHSLPLPIIHPFVEIGYAPRVMNGTIDTSGSFLSSPTQMTSFHTNTSTDWATSHGVVGGAGISVHAGALQLTPQVRYIHWNNAAVFINLPQSQPVQSNQNEVQFLLGIGWRVGGN